MTKQNTNKMVKAVRLKEEVTNLLISTAYICLPSSEETLSSELHLYSVHQDYIKSVYDANVQILDNHTNKNSVVQQFVGIDLVKEFTKINIERGQYKVYANVNINLIGNYNSQKLFIKQISGSRKEIKVGLSLNFPNLNEELYKFQSVWENQIETIRERFVINFGKNEIYEIINFRIDYENSTTPVIYFKLYSPISQEIQELNSFWISQEVITPQIVSVNVIPVAVLPNTNTLRSPNFNIEVYSNNNTATDYKNWEQLINSQSVQTSQQILDSYFGAEAQGVKLNIDYSRFDNFIHFSSAAERVKNFKYKLSLIEYYTQQLIVLNNVDSNDVYLNNNKIDYYNKRNSIVTTFDDFEKYLFFATEKPNLYTNFNNGFEYLVDYNILPWPKSPSAQQLTWAQVTSQWEQISSQWSQFNTFTDAYDYFGILYHIDSQVGEEYYANLLEFAEIYDKLNIHKLQNTIPAFIQEQGDEYTLFVHMCGQHFDSIWTYLKAINKTNTHEEHPLDGVSSQLLAPIAESLGFNLINSKGTSNLWNYLLNDNNNAVSEERYTNEVWRRIVNNLPNLLKSKGTSRSIKALIACFGVPTTLLNVKEYGGPSTFTTGSHFPMYEHDVFHYAYKTETGHLRSTVGIYDNTIYEKTGSSYIPITNPTVTYRPNILEFRFRTDDNYTYLQNRLYNLASISKNQVLDSAHVYLMRVNGYDYVFLIDTANNTGMSALSTVNLFDNNWHTVVVEQNPSTGFSTIRVAGQMYGKITHLDTSPSTSASFFAPVVKNETLTFASGSRTIGQDVLKFNGHINEIRLWSGSLDNETVKEHTLSPSSYTYRADRTLSDYVYADSPYYKLLQRFPLNTNVTSSINSQPTAHPNQEINVGTDYDIYFKDSVPVFEGFEEVFYTPVPSLGGKTIYTDKIRIDDNSIQDNKQLNTQTSVGKSSLSKFAKDSNKVGIYFSPQNSINDDIYNQLGYFEIDDFIGNPQDNYKSSYSSLINFSKLYWKKYQTNNKFEDFFRAVEIYDFTLFKYIKRLLPLRVKPILGLTVEPNVLERSKIKRVGSGSLQNLLHNTEIPYIVRPIQSENIKEHVAQLFPTHSIQLTSEVDNQYVAYMPVMSYISSEIKDFNAGIPALTDDMNKLGNEWEENDYIGKYKIKTNKFYIPAQQIISIARQSNNLFSTKYFYSTPESASLQIPFSSSLGLASVQPTINKFKGSKISGAGININSLETTDGGPVVTVTKVNPNTIVISSGQITTLENSINPSNITE